MTARPEAPSAPGQSAPGRSRLGPARPRRSRPRRRATLAAALSAAGLAAGLLLATPGSAAAGTGACSRGYFCAWQDINYDGLRYTASGSDAIWPSYIWKKDSSWVNNGITGPGIPSAVKVYPFNFQLGAPNICVRPGAMIGYLQYANDRGKSHGWYANCG